MRKLLFVCVLVWMAGSTALAAPNVVATHAVFAEFCEIVGGEHIEVLSIIPSGFCPAHYDLRPSDVRAVARADLVLYSGIEVWMDTLISAAGSDTQVVRLRGSWNTPDAAADKVGEITKILSELFPKHAASFADNARAYQEKLATLAEDLQARAEALTVADVSVLCIAWQESFVSWLGFEVAATYSPPESLTLRDLQRLAEKGEQAGAKLVVDNLQSGVGFGGKLAAEFGAVHVVLSNFPGAMPGTATVIDLLSHNAEALLWAITPLE